MNDITDFEVEETGYLHFTNANDDLMYLKDDDGENDLTKPIGGYFFGPGSKEYAKAQTVNSNKIVARVKKKGNVDQTPEQKAKEDAEFLVLVTDRFENLTLGDLSGAELQKAVYLNPKLGFIKDQVAKHTGDWANFTKG